MKLRRLAELMDGSGYVIVDRRAIGYELVVTPEHVVEGAVGSPTSPWPVGR